MVIRNTRRAIVALAAAGLTTFVLAVAAPLAAAVVAPSAAAGASADKLPDLGITRLGGFLIEKTADGRHLLRYNSIAANVGVGAFEVPANTTENKVWQRIYNDTGGSRDVLTPAQLVMGGDGHNHWHVFDFEKGHLIRTDNGVKVGTLVKRGFCLFDNYQHKLSLPGAPSSAVYRSSGCGTSSSVTLRMGISIGWGDRYSRNLPDQYIDITGVTPGRYRLEVTADPSDWFQETNNGNNTAWAVLQLNGDGTFKVRSRGGHV